ncbi:MAG: hypothetical protein F6K19_28400 [Cyanothece sp. SIO1E1]|nr:hypothetical protein [Cyanothece sp. SIO1E1]
MLQKIKQNVAKDLKAAIDDLIDFCKENNEEFNNSILEIKARYHSWEEQKYQNTLDYDALSRQQNKIRGDFLGLIDMIAEDLTSEKSIPKNLTPLDLLFPPEFIGIKQYVDDIASYFGSEKKDKPFVVNGIGGLGKTTLAQSFYQTHKSQYDYVVWINFRDTLASSFVENENQHLLQNLGLEKLKKENRVDDKFEEIIKKLQTLKNGFIVIDGLDCELEEHETRKLLTLQQNFSWNILITSRHELSGFQIWEYDLPTPESALEIFWLYYNDSTPVLEEKEVVESVLELIGYHPLAVELVAKTIRTSFRLDPQIVLDELQKGQLDKLNSIVSPSRNLESRTLSDHLKVIFDISILNDSQKWLLLQIALLGSTPIKFEDVVYALRISTLDEVSKLDAQLSQLVKQGWLGKESRTIVIHQLIREVIRLQIPLEDGNQCTKLLETFGMDLYQAFRKNQYLWHDKIDYKRYLQSIAEYIKDRLVTHYYALLLDNLAWFYLNSVKGGHIAALGYELMAVEICEKTLPSNHLHLAKVYNLLSLIYDEQGNDDFFWAFQEKSVKIREQYPEHEDYAEAIGNYYVARFMIEERYEEAIRYQNQAISILKNHYCSDAPIFLDLYSSLSLLYSEVKDYSRAFSLAKESYEIGKKHFTVEHPDFIMTIVMILSVCATLSDEETTIPETLKVDIDTFMYQLAEDHYDDILKMEKFFVKTGNELMLDFIDSMKGE